MMKRDTELVIALSCTPLSDAAKQRARAIVNGDLDWGRVFSIAGTFELEPDFFSNQRSLDPSVIPNDICQVATSPALKTAPSRQRAVECP